MTSRSESETPVGNNLAAIRARLGPLPRKVVVDRHLPTGISTYGYTDEMVLSYAAEQMAGIRAHLDAALDEGQP